MRKMQWSRPYAEPLNPGQVFFFSFRPVMDEQRIYKLVLSDRIYLEGSVEIDVCAERAPASLNIRGGSSSPSEATCSHKLNYVPFIISDPYVPIRIVPGCRRGSLCTSTVYQFPCLYESQREHHDDRIRCTILIDGKENVFLFNLRDTPCKSDNREKSRAYRNRRDTPCTMKYTAKSRTVNIERVSI